MTSVRICLAVAPERMAPVLAMIVVSVLLQATSASDRSGSHPTVTAAPGENRSVRDWFWRSATISCEPTASR
jgi:hypothetical protein